MHGWAEDVDPIENAFGRVPAGAFAQAGSRLSDAFYGGRSGHDAQENLRMRGTGVLLSIELEGIGRLGFMQAMQVSGRPTR
jgi:hypothetical protein